MIVTENDCNSATANNSATRVKPDGPLIEITRNQPYLRLVRPLLVIIDSERHDDKSTTRNRLYATMD
jgi:hypothetical protein